MLYLFQSVVLWMKLISYAHVNRDLRTAYRTAKTLDKASVGAGNDNNAKPLQPSFLELQDLEHPYVHYPRNITMRNLLFFSVVPTLCYQLNYPRSPSIRWKYLGTIFFRMVVVLGTLTLTVEQYIVPTLVSSVHLDVMRTGNLLHFVQFILMLSLPSTYVWLLGFYWYFHLWLSGLAELTRFGDREFYKEWWNARSVDTYWRLWNLPVHHWMVRHLYYPILRTGVSKFGATLVVFAFSAVFHEIVISVPFRHVTLFAFFGMLGQAPLVFITKYVDKRFDNAVVGNIIFWCTFCVIGQPMGVIMYYVDLCKHNQQLLSPS